MTPKEAVAMLRQFNEWRRSRELDRFPEIPDMHEVGNAIDVACDALEDGTAPPTAKAIEEAAYRKAAEVIMGSSSLSVEQKNYWAGAILALTDQPSALEEFARRAVIAALDEVDVSLTGGEVDTIVQSVMKGEG